MPKIQANNINLYYEVHGQGEPLLFIHGLGSSTRDWEFQLPAFASSYQVITFDLRGHGQSDKPAGPYTIALFAADTAGLLRALGIPAAHVVGISLGGGIALQLAVDAPQMVKSLTLVNTASEMILRSFKEKAALWQRLLIVRLMGMRKMGEVLSKRLFIRPEEEALRQTFTARWAENDRRAYLDALRAIPGWSVSERLGSIQCPTLVIAADHDYTPVSLKETYTAKIPQARLVVIPDSRHATPAERPEPFNQTLHHFLATQS